MPGLRACGGKAAVPGLLVFGFLTDSNADTRDRRESEPPIQDRLILAGRLKPKF